MKRKLFFGLFVFPLLITLMMAALLCGVVLLTHEEDSPETLLADIKTAAPNHRWHKAFELSNELNRGGPLLESESVLKGILYILRDEARYDSKTRAYMVLALGHFKRPEAIAALEDSALDDEEDLAINALWSLARLGARESVPVFLKALKSEKSQVRKTAAYGLGVLQDPACLGPLEALLEDPVAEVRWNVALALARFKDPAGLTILHQMLDRPWLQKTFLMTESQIESVMINAVKGLALIQAPESASILTEISRQDPSLNVRQAALGALSSRGNKS